MCYSSLTRCLVRASVIVGFHWYPSFEPMLSTSSDFICAPSEDSDPPAHPHSLIRVSVHLVSFSRLQIDVMFLHIFFPENRIRIIMQIVS